MEGSPVRGTGLTPLNSNFGSNRKANGTFVYGENLTNLTGGQRYASGHLVSGQTSEFIMRNWIVMPRNTNLMLAVTENGGNSLTVNIPFFYNIFK